jgi:hypothetical protein
MRSLSFELMSVETQDWVIRSRCSNPSKSPELLRIASTQTYSYLQRFCKLRKDPAKNRAAFARRRLESHGLYFSF